MTDVARPGAGLRRRADRATLGSAVTLLLLAPVSLAALHVFGQLATLWWPALPVWTLTAVWASAGLMMATPAAQRLLVAPRLGLRPPTACEQLRLAASWQAVAARAGVSHDRYLLYVEDSLHINASAAAGHLVAVTSRALGQLPDSQLQAVLAHELGHHQGLHPALALTRVWLTLPVLGLARLAAVLNRLAVAVNRTTVLLGAGRLSHGAALAAWTLFLAATLIALPIRIIGVLERPSRRAAEYRADAVAVDLNYGPALAQTLTCYEEHDRLPWTARLTSDHPTARRRISRIHRRAGQPSPAAR